LRHDKNGKDSQNRKQQPIVWRETVVSLVFCLALETFPHFEWGLLSLLIS
jgi:hypothetical protein